MGVELHIEELVLHGFAAHDRHRIAAAMEVELTRLLSAEMKKGSLAKAAEIGNLNAGAIEVKAGSRPQDAGTQIARAVFRGLWQQSRLPVASSNRGGKGDARP